MNITIDDLIDDLTGYYEYRLPIKPTALLNTLEAMKVKFSYGTYTSSFTGITTVTFKIFTIDKNIEINLANNHITNIEKENIYTDTYTSWLGPIIRYI